jgi:glycoside/pentoside/hexuronide:cation symporter, GPH family
VKAAKTDAETTKTNADERLPLGLKLAYGAPTFAGAAMSLPIFVHMPKFYSDVVLVSLGYIAIAIALARAFDAITDPLMGWVSDRTHSRWGRRRPWMMVGAPLCAVCVVALFTPPQSLTANGAAVWFGVTFILYFLFHTMYIIPHIALGPELTLDYHERSSLFGWREAFALVGTMVAAVAPPLLSAVTEDPRGAFSSMAVIYAVLLIVLYLGLVLRIRERPEFVARKPNPFVPGVRRALRNRPFRILFVTYVVASITAAIPATLMPFFNAYVIRPDNEEIWLAIFIFSYVGAGLLSLPVWVRAARRFGKRPVWLASFWVGITAASALFFLGEGDTIPFLLLIIYAGSHLGAGLLNPAMQADVIDYDELHTGKRREAQYASFWAIVPKFIAIPSAAIPLAILGALGYVPNQPQTPQVIFAIKLILGPTPALFSLLAFFIAWRFPMTESIHRAILQGIELHKRGEAAQDPLTGTILPPSHARAVDEDAGWFLDHFSRGELQRVLRQGPARSLWDVGMAITGSLVVCLATCQWVLSQVTDLNREPSVWVTFAVVAAGFALSGVCFHLLRIKPTSSLLRVSTGESTRTPRLG